MKLFGSFLIGQALGCAKSKPEPECPNDKIVFTGQCVVDNPIDRVLSDASTKFVETKMTMELCREKCDGYAYFGLENSNECFCGQEFRLPLEMVSESECDMECPGNTEESCGGFLRMNIWSQEEYALVLPPGDDGIDKGIN